MSEINTDQKVIQEGRKNTFENEEGVEVQLIDRIPEKLYRKLEEMNVGEKVTRMWSMGNNDRQEWLTRQEAFLNEFDEFINPIYSPSLDWCSTLHMPTTLTVAKTYHARFLQAILDIDPPFTVKAHKEANVDRSQLVQELMQYTLKSWVNDYSGIDDAVDAWVWNWVISGVGILKERWHRDFTRFIDVEDYYEDGPGQVSVDPATGQQVLLPTKVKKQREVSTVKKIADCPMMENVSPEDVCIVGGHGDPQDADAVIQQNYLTASQLWSLADQKIFKKDVVEFIIKAGEQQMTAEPVNAVKQQRTIKSGEAGLDKHEDQDRYQVLECYMKLDVDGSGINSEIVVWVHKPTSKILRATYLYRIMKTGLRPFFKIDFHKRQGQNYGVGIVELLYSLSKEIDAMHNIRVDIGTLTSMPWGFYRPTSSMAQESLPVEPGALVPLDNPQTDVFFPNLGNRTGFGFQEEQALMQQVERLTSVSSVTLGVIGAQGATRTATGTRAIVGESNTNLNIYLKRLNRGWKKALIYLFQMLQQRIEPGFQFRLTGDDGNDYWATIKTPEELRGMYDFDLEAATENSNKDIQIATADLIVQMTSNPIDLQLGIITPLERFAALKQALKARGVRDWSRYIRKPDGITRVFTPEELANRTLAGVDVPLDPTQDLNGFIEFANYLMGHDELLGQFNDQQVVMLVSKVKEAIAMLAALEQQKAQMANIQQQQTNSGQMSNPAAPVAGANAAIEQGMVQ